MARQKITTFLTSEEIFDLGEKLQKPGLFVVDPHHLIQAHRVQDLLVALQVAGEKLTIDRLKTLLAPIFCGTPEQQSVFYAFFEDWIKGQPQIIKRFDFAITETDPKIPIGRKVKTYEKPKRRWLPLIALSLALGVLAIAILVIFRPRTKLQPEVAVQSVQRIGMIIDEENKRPVSNAQLIWHMNTLASNEAGCFTLTITDRDSEAPLSILHPQYSIRNVFVNFNRIQDTLSVKDTLKIAIWKIIKTQWTPGEHETEEVGKPISIDSGAIPKSCKN